MSFDDQYLVEIYIFYDTRDIIVAFKTDSSESALDNFKILVVLQVSFNLNLNSSIYGDEYDRIYSLDIINRFVRANYTLIFNELKSLLYDSSNINRTCDYLTNTNIEINILRIRFYRGPIPYENS